MSDEMKDLYAEIERLTRERDAAQQGSEVWHAAAVAAGHERDEADAVAEKRLQMELQAREFQETAERERDEALKLRPVGGGIMAEWRARRNAEAEVERLEKRVKDLEEAIIISHQTGCWGPIEDAYAAGGYPCLKHRPDEGA